MDKFSILIVIIFSCISNIKCQDFIPPLSQNTNEYIYTSTNNLTYISSIDGLNIYDGHKVKIYRPASHNMYGTNIQSNFYEDDKNNIWFCSYEALHVYDPTTDSLDYFFGIDESKNSLQNDYRIIDLQDSILWFIADKYIFQFDVCHRKIVQRFPSFVKGIKEIVLKETDNLYRFIASSNEGFYNFSIEKSSHELIDSFHLSIPIQPMWLMNDSIVYLGGIDGSLFKYNYYSNHLESKTQVAQKSIAQLSQFNDSVLLVTSFNEKAYFLNLFKEQFVDEVDISIEDESLKNVSSFYKDFNNTHWFGNEGEGVFVRNTNKSKLHFWPKSQKNNTSITAIYPIPNTKDILVTTRNEGILVLNENGEIVQKNSFSTNENQGITIISGTFTSEQDFHFVYNGKNYLYNILSNTYKTLKNVNGMPYGINFTNLYDQNTLVSDYGCKLYFIELIDNSIKTKVAYKSPIKDDYLVSLKTLDNQVVFVSRNEEDVLVFRYNDEKLRLLDTIAIPGGVKSLCYTAHPDSIYLTNTNGLYKIHKDNFGFTKVNHPTKAFSQTIYAIQKAKNDIYWMSTNQGLYSWNPENDSLHQFGLADGLQGLEYNTNAYHQDPDGKMYFGGVNGLNAFYPEDIQLMTHEAPVMLTEYMIGDTVSTEFGMPYYVQDITLPYNRNTLSFRFHALDYADLESTRVKYKLSGIDKEYVIPEDNIGFTRYPNLPAGEYTLSLIGSNADGVWNKDARKITITIHPPFWQEWWFRLLVLLGIVSIVTIVFRSYYKVQLRKKDYQLKEQQLIISRQKALQAERNRIAGEMHDDLGGGLTTIRYLSQRAVKNIENEKSKKQVEKIISQSQELVNNMSEIIWAMNSGFDTLENLVSYIRRFASEYLDLHHVGFRIDTSISNPEIPMSGDVRRNIFLVVKEILHNTVKHTQSDLVTANLISNDERLNLIIQDNGSGLEEGDVNVGNGLKNIENRIVALRGTLKRVNDNGLKYEIEIPLISEA